MLSARPRPIQCCGCANQHISLKRLATLAERRAPCTAAPVVYELFGQTAASDVVPLEHDTPTAYSVLSPCRRNLPSKQKAGLTISQRCNVEVGSLFFWAVNICMYSKIEA